MYYYCAQNLLDQITLPNQTIYYDLKPSASELFLRSIRLFCDDTLITDYSIISLPKLLRSPLWECYLTTVIKHKPNKSLKIKSNMDLLSEDLTRSKSTQDKKSLVKEIIESWANDYPHFQYTQGMDLLATVVLEGFENYIPKTKKFFYIFFFLIKFLQIRNKYFFSLIFFFCTFSINLLSPLCFYSSR